MDREHAFGVTPLDIVRSLFILYLEFQKVRVATPQSVFTMTYDLPR
jgi:hypothetical protein